MSETKLTPKAVVDLLNEVEALCQIYVGKNAPGEQWRDTLERIDRMAKTAKRARAALAKPSPTPEG